MFCNLELLLLGGSLFFPIFLSLIFLSNVFFPLWPSALKIFLPPSSACLTMLRICYAWTPLGRLNASGGLATTNLIHRDGPFLLARLNNSLAALACPRIASQPRARMESRL